MTDPNENDDGTTERLERETTVDFEVSDPDEESDSQSNENDG